MRNYDTHNIITKSMDIVMERTRNRTLSDESTAKDVLVRFPSQRQILQTGRFGILGIQALAFRVQGCPCGLFLGISNCLFIYWQLLNL